MTIVDKLYNYMDDLEDIALQSNTSILMGYYIHLGMDTSESVSEWLVGVSNGTYPPYSSVTRSIRKNRQLHPKWRKLNKQQQVDTAKKEIGY